MSKTSKIIRSIIAGIMLVMSVISLVYIITAVVGASAGGLNGLALLIPIQFFIYEIPVAIAIIIYQIVLKVKKKVWKVDLITSIIFLVIWALQIIVPYVFSAIVA